MTAAHGKWCWKYGEEITKNDIKTKEEDAKSVRSRSLMIWLPLLRGTDSSRSTGRGTPLVPPVIPASAATTITPARRGTISDSLYRTQRYKHGSRDHDVSRRRIVTLSGTF